MSMHTDEQALGRHGIGSEDELDERRLLHRLAESLRRVGGPCAACGLPVARHTDRELSTCALAAMAEEPR